MTGLAGDVRESQNMAKNAPKPDAKLLASEPSKGLQMGQGFRKGLKSMRGSLGDHLYKRQNHGLFPEYAFYPTLISSAICLVKLHVGVRPYVLCDITFCVTLCAV